MRITTTRRSSLPRRAFSRRPSALVESFESRILFAIDVTIGTGVPVQTVSFTDADGTAATVRITGGTATVTFDGTGLSQSTTGRAVSVAGTNVVMTNLVITGTNPSVTIAN